MSTDDNEGGRRRGRPALAKEDRKSASLKFRTRTGVRERLEVEAAKKSRSVSEEAEWRIEKSFDYDSIDGAVNEAFLRYMRVFFGGSNNPAAMAVMASFWSRAIDTANKQVKSDTHWASDELKQRIMIEVMQRAAKQAVRDAAYTERRKQGLK